ncbi:MAG: hypothetical protein QGI89_05135 [Candidatus Woesearchaeota archaeon]|jgi:hypothetical protein|nr:hypothetical protein [Candidatus Woesearchaeota archaeon]HJO01720.1 hypothetical protein [Candidatus Woesearchaeota archaeon]
MSAQYEGVTFYKNLEKDPIGSITAALVENLGNEKFHLARIDYDKLIATIESRDRSGKDIRYAGKKLGELSRRASSKGQDCIAKKADSYIGQLPNPMEDGRRSKSYNQQSTDWNPVENDKTLYGEVAEVVNNAVVDCSDGQRRLNQKVIDAVIAGFTKEGVDIRTVPTEKIVDGYDYLKMFNPREYDLSKLARMFVDEDADVSKLEVRLSEEEGNFL